jgi:topoisomerase-4 subunit A
VLVPVPIANRDSDRLVAVTSSGHLLVFSVQELPQLPRGKGNKIMAIPPAKLAAREEYLVALASIPAGESVTLHCGKRHLTLRPSDLDLYGGERGRRGKVLPRGFQRVERLVIGENKT